MSDAVLCLLSAGYYMGMCVAAPEKNLVNIYQVGRLVLSACSLHGATPSVVYLRKHIYADVDPGEQAVHLESEPCYEFTLAHIKHYQKNKTHDTGLWSRSLTFIFQVRSNAHHCF